MVWWYMNNELINQLSKLKLQESANKRNLDRNYYNIKVRDKLFNELKEVQSEIKRIEFKIKLEKENKKNEDISD